MRLPGRIAVSRFRATSSKSGYFCIAAVTRVWRDFSPEEEIYEFGLNGMRQGWAEAAS